MAFHLDLLRVQSVADKHLQPVQTDAVAVDDKRSQSEPVAVAGKRLQSELVAGHSVTVHKYLSHY
jgi:hypothetical protein